MPRAERGATQGRWHLHTLGTPGMARQGCAAGSGDGAARATLSRGCCHPRCAPAPPAPPPPDASLTPHILPGAAASLPAGGVGRRVAAAPHSRPVTQGQGTSCGVMGCPRCPTAAGPHKPEAAPAPSGVPGGTVPRGSSVLPQGCWLLGEQGSGVLSRAPCGLRAQPGPPRPPLPAAGLAPRISQRWHVLTLHLLPAESQGSTRHVAPRRVLAPPNASRPRSPLCRRAALAPVP